MVEGKQLEHDWRNKYQVISYVHLFNFHRPFCLYVKGSVVIYNLEITIFVSSLDGVWDSVNVYVLILNLQQNECFMNKKQLRFAKLLKTNIKL